MGVNWFPRCTLRNAAAKALIAASLCGCGATDSDYIPYAIKGLDVWVSTKEGNRSYYGGRVDTWYFSRESGLAECRHLAIEAARVNHLENWGYVCCTVTSSSDCETKVR
jgi:hypothetical protein